MQDSLMMNILKTELMDICANEVDLYYKNTINSFDSIRDDIRANKDINNIKIKAQTIADYTFDPLHKYNIFSSISIHKTQPKAEFYDIYLNSEFNKNLYIQICKNAVINKLSVDINSPAELLAITETIIDNADGILLGVLAKYYIGSDLKWINVTHPLCAKNLSNLKTDDLHIEEVIFFTTSKKDIDEILFKMGAPDEYTFDDFISTQNLDGYCKVTQNLLDIYDNRKKKIWNIKVKDIIKDIKDISNISNNYIYDFHKDIFYINTHLHDIYNINTVKSIDTYYLIPHQCMYCDIVMPFYGVSLFSYSSSNNNIESLGSLTPFVTGNVGASGSICSGDYDKTRYLGLVIHNQYNEKSEFHHNTICEDFLTWISVNIQTTKNIIGEYFENNKNNK